MDEHHDLRVTLWAKLLDEWEKEDRHRAFIALCAESNGLDFAARRYREILDKNPNDYLAKAGQERTLSLAIQRLDQSRPVGGAGGGQRKRKRSKQELFYMGIFGAVMIFIILFWLYRLRMLLP